MSRTDIIKKLFSLKLQTFLLFGIILTFLLPPSVNSAEMEDYCIIPPYVKRDVPPNIMILMDNSNDMFNQAFTDNYDPTKTYIGYFKPDKMYKYSALKFVECTSGADCIFSGNLMNWATMSRFDILQKVLIGGHTASRQAHAHTLGSISGEWTKIWGNCKFSVSSANLTISDSGGTCDLSRGAETTCPNPTDNPDQFSQSTGNGHRRNNPSIITPSSNKLPDAEIDKCYSFTFEAKWGTPEGTRYYTWDITIGSLPAGLYLHADSGKIYGKPTATGTSTFRIRVRNKDNLSQSDYKDVTLEVKTGTGTRFRQYNVKVDLPEEPLNDLNGNDIWDPGETFTDLNGNGQWDGKKGVVQEFWDEVNPRARWGMTDFFKNDARVDIEVCIPASPAASFYTAIQNATPAPLSPLAKGVYGATHYFIASTDGRPEYQSNAYHGCVNKDPIDDTPCRLNFILMITSGSDVSGPQLPTGTTSCVESINGDCLKANTSWAYSINDLRNDKDGRQYLSTYIVHTLFGESPVDCETASGNTRVLCDAASMGGGKYYAADTDNLEEKLREALRDILRRAASGTAASVLASGEGQGANLIQAVFYPRTPSIVRGGIFSKEISWIGRLANFWYYIDPYFATSTILEDTTSDSILNLSNDNVVNLRYDTDKEYTVGDLYDYGSMIPKATVKLEYIKSLWEAGIQLWERTVTPSNPGDANNRTIFTSCVSGTTCLDVTNPLTFFSITNATALQSYLQAENSDEAQSIIRWVHGEDTQPGGNFATNPVSEFNPDYRSRTVNICEEYNDATNTCDAWKSVNPKVWKLGDILSSTPRIASWVPLNEYHRVYKDTTYGPINPDLIRELNLNKLSDPNSYLTSNGYIHRGIVFAGGNDGMLHAFKLGKLELKWSGQGKFEKARLTGTDLGKELWAFIPKNALPYLKYISNPDYCHVYTVDLSPFIFDASINGDPNDTKTVSSWRTILIGGMRFGGACKPKNDNCVTDTPNSVCAPTEVGGTSIGFSSYFALDITATLANPDDPIGSPPVLLWEFSHPDLGFTTTGPAVTRINADGDSDGRSKNGHWFVVLGSGPTGPINTIDLQFLGRSDQNLRLFVLDLKAGNLLRTIDTGIQYAFAGSMINSTYDHKVNNYQDDAIYVPYVKRTGISPNYRWTEGGIGRLVLHDPVSKTETYDVSKWEWKPLMDNIGPVTSSITHLYHPTNKIAWLFFGTGRYYYELSNETDDATGQRRIFGIKEPCIQNGTFDPTECTTVSFGDLTDVTCSECDNIEDLQEARECLEGCVPSESDTKEPAFKGWYIDLDLCTNSSGVETASCADPSVYYWTERVITDPLASPSTGAVFYTTFRPYKDECSIGGKSHIWAVNYSTGGEIASLLKGKALLQVSTAVIEEVDLSTAFTEKGARRTTGMEGVPPSAQGLVVIGQPKPVKSVVHIRER